MCDCTGKIRASVMVVLLVLVIGATTATATVFYVDADASGLNTGSSWEDAFTDLQAALAAAVVPGDQIWVADGVYHPSVEVGGSGSRYWSFQLKNGIAFYGGFAGGETDLEDRDPDTNPAVLSGDIGVPDDTSDNCYHVFYHPNNSNLDDTAVLDGFVLTGGNADGTGDARRAGGMYNHDASPTIANCTFNENMATAISYADGGAMANRYSSPLLINCVFSNNTCAQYGGAVANMSTSAPTFLDCHFEGNVGGLDGSAVGNAGAMFNYGGCATLLVGCTFVNNSCNFDGGAVWINGAAPSPTFINCGFSDNTAVLYGGGVRMDGGSEAAFIQCRFDGNRATASNGHGGALLCTASDPVISGCVFYDNESG